MDIERKALLKLKEGLTGPSDRQLSSWVGVDCCKWRGVGCNKTSGRVDSLNLSNPYRDGLDSDDGTLHALGGTIPTKIGNLESIETLDLSINQLSGSIPPSMVSLTFLSYLNLSYNHLSGEVPTGNQLSTLVDPSIYEGNAALCGYPLPNDCQDNEEIPQVPTEDGEDSDDSELEKLWFIISMVIGFIVGFWGVCGSLVINKSWRHAYFNFLDKVKYVLIDFVSVIRKYLQLGT